MNKKLLGAIFFMAALVGFCFANGATYTTAKSSKHMLTLREKVYPPLMRIKPMKPHFTTSATIKPGSMKANINRILQAHGWHMVWDLPFDYNFVGSVKIRSVSIEGVMQKLLKSYPLQAVFYQGNHVVEIRSRTL